MIVTTLLDVKFSSIQINLARTQVAIVNSGGVPRQPFGSIIKSTPSSALEYLMKKFTNTLVAPTNFEGSSQFILYTILIK